MEHLGEDQYAKDLFMWMFENEKELHPSWAVFYHSYSHAAILYEVRAAAAALLHGYQGEGSFPPAPLPRLCQADFAWTPTATELMKKVRTEWGPTKSDHNPAFRSVGISGMCSLLATGPECCMQVAFFIGYSCKKVAFRDILQQEVTAAMGISSYEEASILVEQLLELASRHGLDTSIINERSSPSGHAGHILQIFVRRDHVDKLCYAAKPYGEIDEERMPFSQWMNGDHSFTWGQARILAHPRFFMDPNIVKMYVISADPTFQAGRAAFHEELKSLLRSSGPGAE